LILSAALSIGPGFVSPVSAQVHSYILNSNGKGLTDLGTLSRGEVEARGINDAGQVAGEFHTAEGALHAFIAGPYGAGMTDLNSLVEPAGTALMSEAVDIDNVGQIIALGFPIPAIPELQFYALMLACLILLGFMAPRKSPFA
jgi:probable HAF family extracellular repeat protein